MQLRVLAAGALALGLALIPADAYAKGARGVSISGPGLSAPIQLSVDPSAGRAGPTPTRAGPNELANAAGLFAAFGSSPIQPVNSSPGGDLGPRYQATYDWLVGPNATKPIRQDLYPFATGGPLTYVPPRQRVFAGQTLRGGWYHASPGLKDLLVAAGVPAPQSSTGHGTRCRSVTPRAQSAARAIPRSVNQGRYWGQPDLGPHEVIVGHGALWVLRNLAVASPGFDVYTDTWGMKFPWFRTQPGTLTITGRRLDGPGQFSAWIPPAGSYSDTGFLPTGLVFSTGGCWQVTGHLRSSRVTISFDFSSSPQAVCTQLAAQLSNVAPYLTFHDGSYPHNLAYAQVLEAAIQSRNC